MTTSTQITPEAALAKFNAFVQSQQMQDYLSQRQQQYTSTPKGGTGWTAATVLDNPFAGLKDFGTYERPRLEYVGQGEEGGYEYKTDTVNKTAGDILSEKFADKLGHKSTFLKAYKQDEKGNPVETDLNAFTPEEISSGKVVIYMGGATGGRERERMAQAYIPQGDKLIPVGDPTYYKGEHPDAKNVANALKIASIVSLPFGGIGAFLGPVTGTVTSGLASLGLPAMAANIGANALVQGTLSGGISKLTGGDFSKGFKSGATSGAIGAGLGELGAMSGLDKGLGALYAPAKSIATSGLTSAALGRPFNFSEAAKNAALSYGLQQALGSTDLAPKQGEALNKFLEFLGGKA